MIHRAFLASLVHPAASLLYLILPAWRVTKWIAWARWPAWVMAAAVGAITALLTAPAQAGWFWGPDPKVEAANRALERAAQIATEAARTQSSQQSQLLAAIEALSSERAQIAGQFGRLGEMAARDSAWAAALQAAGPVLVAVVVLALGCTAIWMVTRAGDHDSQLATVLVDEITGTGAGTGGFLRQPRQGVLFSRSGPTTRGLEYDDEDRAHESLEEQEMPF